jgi:glutamate racemase
MKPDTVDIIEQRKLPIGVFDSGLGGLSVLKELRIALPDEDFLYLGDVARLPYGSKSSSVVVQYARRCLEFLLSKPVKAVVIACNTATAMALEPLRQECTIDLLGVIEPGVRAGLAATRSGRVLVLATEATVKSQAYLREFERKSPGISVEQIACPLLVPLAEEGWFDHPITREVISTYLARAAEREYDVVLLGCTHYPLLEKSFRAVVSEGVTLVHGGRSLAEQVRECLAARGLLRPSSSPGHLELFATDHIPKSLPLLSGLFGGSAQFELVDL